MLITGSAQGLGLLAGRQLIAAGHEVVLHARNPTRARAASAAAPGASGVVVGDPLARLGIGEVERNPATIRPEFRTCADSRPRLYSRLQRRPEDG